MRALSRLLAIAAARSLLSAPARAQATGDPALSSPRAAVNAAFDAMSHKQWARVAALSDSAFLATWREQQLVYADADKIEKDNKKKHQKQYGLPKCVQKYFESQESHYSDTFLKGFAGAKSIAQLETLTPEQLFASWLAGGDAGEGERAHHHAHDPRRGARERVRHARDLPDDADAAGHE